jgi:hypothetical protein
MEGNKINVMVLRRGGGQQETTPGKEQRMPERALFKIKKFLTKKKIASIIG